MRIRTLLWMVSFQVCLAPVMSFAACLGKDPVDAAKSLFRDHRNFANETPARLKGLASSELHNALTYEYNCKNGQICAIDFDLWTSAQDGDIVGPISFDLVSDTDRHAVVAMRYKFTMPSFKRPQTAKLIFERGTSQACWVLADLITPNGKSTLSLIQKYRTEFGKNSDLPFNSD